MAKILAVDDERFAVLRNAVEVIGHVLAKRGESDGRHSGKMYRIRYSVKARMDEGQGNRKL